MLNAYIKYTYADKGRSKFVLSDNGKEFSSASMAYIAGQLGLTKVYTSPYSPHLNSVIERCHNFIKNLIRKLRCNYERDWDHLAHIAVMTYNGLLLTQLQVKVHSFSSKDEMCTYQLCTICYNQRCAIWVVMNARYT